jgi:hypothetical protein
MDGGDEQFPDEVHPVGPEGARVLDDHDAEMRPGAVGFGYLNIVEYVSGQHRARVADIVTACQVEVVGRAGAL